jgi:serine/threonine-protein kinase
MEEEITQVQPAAKGGMLGNYRLGSPLGQGLLGVVYEGFNPVANKPCAVKVFRQDLPGGAVNRGRYINETETAARIGHSNIAQTYVSGFAEGRLYTTMERLAGTNLASLLRQQAPLSRRAYFPLLREICAGLAAAHAYNIAHRHLHPAQIMVQWEGQGPEVKLLDFGTHHLVPPFNEAPSGWEWLPVHAICIAPEQARGSLSADCDSRSDIYAVSVMLYEMVTGRVPFLADTFAATLEQHINEPPTPPSQITAIPTGLEETIMRGLEKDPRKRIPSVEALLAAIDPMAVTGQHQLLRATKPSTGRHVALMSQEMPVPVITESTPEGPTSLGEPGPPPQVLVPPDRLPRSRWWLFALLAVVMVACGITITLLLLDDDEPKPPKPTSTTTPPMPTGVRRVKVGTVRAPSRPAPKKATEEQPPAPKPAPPSGKISPALTSPRRGLTGRPVKKIEGIGALEVSTPSDDAQVFVNGRFKGKGKLVILSDLPSGLYRIHLAIKGKKTPHRDVQIQPNKRLTIKF